MLKIKPCGLRLKILNIIKQKRKINNEEVPERVYNLADKYADSS